MVSTLEVSTVIVLLVVLGIAIWWFIVAKRYQIYLSSTTYTRGANLSGPGQVNLTCEGGRQIQITSAVQTCMDPDQNNFENPDTDPISNAKSTYGEFNPATTLDLVDDMTSNCNGQEQCTYQFKPSSQLTCSGTPQLIATYDCVPSS